MQDDERRGGGARPQNGFSARAVASGTLLSVVATFLGGLVIGLVVSLTHWSEAPRSLLSFGYLSIAVGGVLAGKIARRTGWLHGGLVGIAYMVITALLPGDGALEALTSVRFITGASLGFVVGAVGGMLGVNMG